MEDRKEYLTDEIWHKKNIKRLSEREVKNPTTSDYIREFFIEQVKKLDTEIAELEGEMKTLRKPKNEKSSKRVRRRS